MFIAIVDDDKPFDWSPVREETGESYESVFQLRLVSDEADKEIRKRHTKQVWDKKQRRTVDKLDEGSYAVDLIDYAIVGWAGIRSARGGIDLPCSRDMKGRLPEKVKVEILRLCAGKEAGDVVSAAEQEKKALPTS